MIDIIENNWLAVLVVLLALTVLLVFVGFILIRKNRSDRELLERIDSWSPWHRERDRLRKMLLDWDKLHESSGTIPHTQGRFNTDLRDLACEFVRDMELFNSSLGKNAPFPNGMHDAERLFGIIRSARRVIAS